MSFWVQNVHIILVLIWKQIHEQIQLKLIYFFPYKSKNIMLDIKIFYFEGYHRKCSLLGQLAWSWPALLSVADRRQRFSNRTKLHPRWSHLQFNPKSWIVFFYRNQQVKLFQPGLHWCCGCSQRLVVTGGQWVSRWTSTPSRCFPRPGPSPPGCSGRVRGILSGWALTWEPQALCRKVPVSGASQPGYVAQSS